MKARSIRSAVSSAPLAAFAFVTLALAAAAAHAGTEIKGAAILKHPCGRIAVEHMGLVHLGKMDEATKLASQKMQEEWAAMPAPDREMMSGMMKEMSMTKEEFSKAIEANGTLAIDGKSATLSIVKETKDENGTSTETTTQKYEVDGDSCRITH